MPPPVPQSESPAASKERPISPHLQIYRWQWTMALSITHRATGTFLALAVVVFAALLCIAAFWSPQAFRIFVAVVQHPLFLPVNVLIVWAMLYHLLNGVRHLIWDTTVMLALPYARASGYFVLIASIVCTCLYFLAL